MPDTISYKGCTEAEGINALYHGTAALGFGALHDMGSDFTVETAQKMLDDNDAMNDPHGEIPMDYVAGHPFKITLDIKAKTFDGRLYDRDSRMAARDVIAALLASK